MIEGKDNGWTKADMHDEAIDIDEKKNYKGVNVKNFKNLDEMIRKCFRAGATRIVDDLAADKTLYDKQKKKLWPEGVVEVLKSDKLGKKLEIEGVLANPGSIISEMEIKLKKITPVEKSNNCFRIKPRLSLVTNNLAEVDSNGETWSGICARGVKCSDKKNKIIGNMSVHFYGINGKKQISGELIYDGTLRDEEKFTVDKSMGKDEKSAYVVTISPIPQEIIDWNNIQYKKY